MQPDREAQRAHRANRGAELRLRRRLAAGEHDRVEQPAPRREPRERRRPVLLVRAVRRQQMRVVAVAAAPRTALQEEDRRELARPVRGREPDNAADAQRRHAARRRVIAGIAYGLHRCNGG